MRSDFYYTFEFYPSPSPFFFLNAKFVIYKSKALNEVYHLAYSELAFEQLPLGRVARCEELPE